MAGDDTAGLDPGDFFIAQHSGCGVQGGADRFVHIGCIDEVQMVRFQIVLFGKLLQQRWGQLGQVAAVLLTGNESAGELYALYFDASLYDGMTYYTGKKVLQGNIVLKNNVGGEAYLGEGTVLAIPGEGLGADTYIPVTLHSGVISEHLFGEYDYEGGDLEYIITAGNRSITDPEFDPIEATETQQQNDESSNILLYVGIGVVALVAVAAILLILKKKKPASAEKN